jgi:hypothetical protein
MTTVPTTADRDLAAMLGALDAGDDSVLPYLADLLEEAQDFRAAGVRSVAEWALLAPPGCPCRPAPIRGVLGGAFDGWRWQRQNSYTSHRPDVLANDIFDALPDPDRWYPHGGTWSAQAGYPTRSGAYLALAEALTPTSSRDAGCPGQRRGKGAGE